MYCRNCRTEVPDQAAACAGCGLPPGAGARYCQNCGAETAAGAEVCLQCGVRLTGATGKEKDRLVALLLSVFLGGLGAHRFYTGHYAIGVIQLLTAGGFVIWWFLDVVRIITGSFKDAEGRPLVRK